jgi:hypothetical protein
MWSFAPGELNRFIGAPHNLLYVLVQPPFKPTIAVGDIAPLA